MASQNLLILLLARCIVSILTIYIFALFSAGLRVLNIETVICGTIVKCKWNTRMVILGMGTGLQ